MFERVEIDGDGELYSIITWKNGKVSSATGLTWQEVVKRLTPKRSTGKDENFDQFWDAYPKDRRNSKVKARESWKRLYLDKHIDAILDGVQRHKKTEQWLKGFIPNAVTYLNQRRWEDILELAKTVDHKQSRFTSFFKATQAENIFGADPRLITPNDWEYGAKSYFGAEEGLTHKQTGDVIRFRDYKPIA